MDGASSARRPRVVVLGALSAFGPLSIDMYLPGLPSVGSDLSASASATALTLTACIFGLGAGGLIAGPVSDAVGRMRPLVLGVAAFSLAGFACAFAQDVWTLSALRLIQGFGGSAGLVISRAMVRDSFDATAMARIFGLMLLTSGLAPILAPLIGAQLLHFTDWRGIFVVLGVIGIGLALAAGLLLDETLPRARRRPGGLRRTAGTFRVLLADRRFVGHIAAVALYFVGVFGYISASPYVLEHIHGLSPQLFAVVIAANACGIVTMGQLSARIVTRHGPERLLAASGTVGLVAAVAVTVVVLSGGGLASLLPAAAGVRRLLGDGRAQRVGPRPPRSPRLRGLRLRTAEPQPVRVGSARRSPRCPRRRGQRRPHGARHPGRRRGVRSRRPRTDGAPWSPRARAMTLRARRVLPGRR